jgi:hypothetical protein
MDKITPGRKLILDLLAKSVAKFHALSVEAINNKEMDGIDTEMGKIQKKRKTGFEIPRPRKNKKAVHEKRLGNNLLENKKKEYVEEDSFKVKSESKALDVETLHIKIKTESLDFDTKDKVRKSKSKKEQKCFEMGIGTGNEMNKNVPEIAVKAKTQELFPVSLMIEQKVKPVKRKMKTEIDEVGQEEPIDTKNGTFKIKREYVECKVETDNDVNDGTTEPCSVDNFKTEFDVFKKEIIEGSKRKKQFDIKTSKNVLKNFF